MLPLLAAADEGLIHKRPSPDDGRPVPLGLTDEGLRRPVATHRARELKLIVPKS